TRFMTLPACPSIVWRSISLLTLFPRHNLRPPPQMRRYPSHSDETCAKLGVGAARKLRARARIGTALTATQAFRFALSDGAIVAKWGVRRLRDGGANNCLNHRAN